MRSILIFTLILVATTCFSLEKIATVTNANLKLKVSKQDGNFSLLIKKGIKWVPLLSENAGTTSFFGLTLADKYVDLKEKKLGGHSTTKGNNNIIYNWQNNDLKLKISYYLVGHKSAHLSIKANLQNISKKEVRGNFLACFDENNTTKLPHYFLSDGSVSKNYIRNREFDTVILSSIHSNLKLELVQPIIRPTKMFSANWRAVKDNLPNYNIDTYHPFDTPPYAENDSAWFIEYKNFSIASGESLEYRYRLTLDTNNYENLPSLTPDSTEYEIQRTLDEMNNKLNNNEIINEDILYFDRKIKRFEENK